MRVFPEVITIWVSKVSKSDGPLQWGRASSNALRTNRTKMWRGKEHFLPPPSCLSYDISLLQLLDWDLYHWSSWFAGLQNQLELHYWLSWVCSLQMTNHRTSQFSSVYEPIPCNKSLYKYMYLSSIYHILLVCFSVESYKCMHQNAFTYLIF